MPWDVAIEDALSKCLSMMVILSTVSVGSVNVCDEVAFALDRQKRVIPVLYRDCEIPFRLARLQHIDFRSDYVRGLKMLRNALAPPLPGQTHQSQHQPPSAPTPGPQHRRSP